MGFRRGAEQRTQLEERLAGGQWGLRGLRGTDAQISSRPWDIRFYSSGEIQVASEPMKTPIQIFLLTVIK